MSIIDQQIYVPGPGGGLVRNPAIPGGVSTLPGSGLAVPGGLECVFEYNNLFMNIQQTVDRYRITNIDGLHDADVRDTRDQNTNSDGETPYNSFYGGRTIVISLTVDTYSVPKLRDMEMALRSAFNDLTTEYPLYFRTGNFNVDHYINCKKISPITSSETQANQNVTRDFQITLRASNPRFLSYYQKFVDAYPSASIIAPVPLIVESGGITPVPITNIGTYKAQPVFRIYGPSSTSTFLNQTTNQSFSLSGQIAFNDYLEFDLSGNTKSLQNSTGGNYWNYLSDGSQYVDLASGDNFITYQGDATHVQVFWRDSWI